MYADKALVYSINVSILVMGNVYGAKETLLIITLGKLAAQNARFSCI